MTKLFKARREYVLCWRDEVGQHRLCVYDTMSLTTARSKAVEAGNYGDVFYICRLVPVRHK